MGACASGRCQLFALNRTLSGGTRSRLPRLGLDPGGVDAIVIGARAPAEETMR
jgi:hypothetical protein